MSRNSGKQGPMILRLNFFQKLALFAPPLQFFFGKFNRNFRLRDKRQFFLRQKLTKIAENH
jgi:hypothetical protein